MKDCPVCDQTSWKVRFRIVDWDVEECPACRFAKLSPMPTFEKRKDFYSEEKVVTRIKKKRGPVRQMANRIKAGFGEISKRDKSDIFYKKLLSNLSPGASILDIACGDGAFLEKAKNQFKCTGNEISEYLAGLAQKRGGMEIITGDFMTTDFGGRKFDAITLISLIEHLNDPERALRRCFDLLNEGGMLILKTVNYDCLNQRFMKAKWTGFRPPDHMVYFTPKNLQDLLRKIGFTRFQSSAFPLNDNMYVDAWR